MKKILNNKQGISYIISCVLILISVMLISIAMQYAYVYHIARTNKNEVQLLLDSYVTLSALDNYDALKQGVAYDKYIDHSSLVNDAYGILGFSQTGKESVDYEGYTMYRPKITAMRSSAFGVTAEYEIIIPFKMFNREVSSIRVPISITSQFKQK